MPPKSSGQRSRLQVSACPDIRLSASVSPRPNAAAPRWTRPLVKPRSDKPITVATTNAYSGYGRW